MPKIEIRPAISSDIAILVQFNHTVETSHVWQMDTVVAEKDIEVRFKETKLPRSLSLVYPKSIADMADTWTKHDLFLVARLDEKLVGYLILEISKDTQLGLVTDLVVDTEARRLGIASGLIVSTRNWLKQKGLRRENIAIQSKNHAAISLAKKLKMDYCGYIDSYFTNRDTAIIFTSVLK
jgi:ribosomal protein S18 acetylase RimI-like enzyme